MTTITAPTTSSVSPMAWAVLAAALVLFLLSVAIAFAAMAPAVPSHELLQNTTPIYIDTTPLSGPQMY
jgi:hypothetical protein